MEDRANRTSADVVEGEGLPEAWVELELRLDPEQWRAWQHAAARMRNEMGDPDHVTVGDLLVEMSRRVLATDADGRGACPPQVGVPVPRRREAAPGE